MNPRSIEVAFTLKDAGVPDLTGSGIWLGETLQAEIEAGGQWKVSNPIGHSSWIGRADTYVEAVLNYLKARCGIGTEDELGELHDNLHGHESREAAYRKQVFGE